MPYFVDSLMRQLESFTVPPSSNSNGALGRLYTCVAPPCSNVAFVKLDTLEAFGPIEMAPHLLPTAEASLDVNIMGSAAVPSAVMEAGFEPVRPTSIRIPAPLLNCTLAPGAMVRSAPVTLISPC